MAGFGRNGSRSSPKAIASAERHGEWLRLRRAGLSEKEIGSRYGVSQQAVSKALLKHVRDMPAREAEYMRRTQAAYLVSMHEIANQAYEQARSDKARLKILGMVLGLLEREAKLLSLDAPPRIANIEEATGSGPGQGTVFELLARVEPLSAEMLKQIQELDPIEKPDTRKALTAPVLLTISVTT